MYRSILNERSPYAWKTTDPRLPNTGGVWSWSTVLQLLERFEATGEAQALPREVQWQGARIGLSVGLAVAQLALTWADVRCWGWPEPRPALDEELNGPFNLVNKIPATAGEA